MAGWRTDSCLRGHVIGCHEACQPHIANLGRIASRQQHCSSQIQIVSELHLRLNLSVDYQTALDTDWMFNLEGAQWCLTSSAGATPADPCTRFAEGLAPTIGALQVEMDHVPRMQEGQAARNVQRDGFPEARLPLAIGATLPVQPNMLGA